MRQFRAQLHSSSEAMDEPRTNRIEDLLRDAEWMRALARRLVTDREHVDDAFQDAWVLALEKSEEPRAGSRPWIAGVFKNLARERWRGERARERRERMAARPEALPSTADVVARAQAQGRLVEAVLALPEPTRSTVLLHYFDGLSAEEIARREHVPGSTVRNRLSRGIADLRRKLERDSGAGWAALLMPLADVPTGSGPALATAANTTAWTSTAVLGGLGMSTAAKFAIGIVGVLALAWWAWPGDAQRQMSALGAGSPAHAEVVLAESAPDRDAARTPAVSREIADPQVSSSVQSSTRTDGLVSLLVRVTWAEDGLAAPNAPLRVLSWGAPDPFAYAETRVTGADGTARFDGLHPGDLRILCAFGGDASVIAAAGESKELSLAIRAGIVVEGEVVDGLGRAVPNASIWLSDYGNGVDGEQVALAGSDGRFRLRAIGAGRRVAARAAGFAPSPSYDVNGAPGDVLRPRIVMTGPGGALRGTVRGPRGNPIAGALVQAGRESSSSFKDPDGRLLSTPPPLRVHTDGDGRYEFVGVAPGRVPVVVRMRGLAPWTGNADVEIDRASNLVVDLAAGAVVRGTVMDGDGQPLEQIFVGHGGYGQLASAQTYSAADGSFVLEGLPAGQVELRADGRDQGKLRTTMTLTAGGEAVWDPILTQGPGIAGRVLDDAGAPLANWSVTAMDGELAGGRQLLSKQTNERGEFDLVNWPKEAVRIEVRDPDSRTNDAVVTVLRPQVGQRDLVIRVPSEVRATASFEGRVLDERGCVITDASVSLWRVDAQSGSIDPVDAQTGAFRIAPIRPGTYRVGFEAPGRGQTELPEFTVAANEHKDLGAIVLAPAGSVRVEIVESPGAEFDTDIRASIVEAHGRTIETVSFEESRARPVALAPGTYVVRLYETKVRADEATFVVESGVESVVRLRLEPATFRVIEVATPADFDLDQSVRIVVTDAQGRSLADHTQTPRPDRPCRLFATGLKVGNYTAEASTKSGLTGRTTIAVADLIPPAANVIVNLR